MNHGKLFHLLLPAAVAGLVFCSEEQEQSGELAETPVTEEVAAVLPPDIQAGLEEVNGSGVTGTAGLSPSGDQVQVEVVLDGAADGQSYLAHIHRGECGDDQGVAVSVGDLIATDGQVGITTTIEQIALEPGENYFLQVHTSDQTPVACANLMGTGLDSPAGAKTSVQGETY